MKLLCTLCGTLLLPLFLTAQQSVTAVSKAAEIRTGPADSRMRTVRSGDRDADDVIWCDDFANPELWIAEGPSDDYDTYGWSIADTTASWFDEIERDMATSGNFARFQNGDPDDFIEDGPFTLTFIDAIDLSDVPAPHLEIEQYGAKFFTVQAIEVSVDDGDSWSRVMDNNDIYPLTEHSGLLYPRPEYKRTNLSSAIADNPSNVMIRFYWAGGENMDGNNYIDYGWYIDNVRIVEGYEFDAEIQSAHLRMGVGGFFENGLDYFNISKCQVSPLTLSANIINQGYSSISNCHLITEIEQDGIVYSGSSDNINLDPIMPDSLTDSTMYTPPLSAETYNVKWYLESDETDSYNVNDTIRASFKKTLEIYGRDNEIQTRTFTNVSGNVGQQVAVGNVMEIFGNAEIYEIEVSIPDLETNIGNIIFGNIMKYSVETEEWEYVEETVEYTIREVDLGRNLRMEMRDEVGLIEGDVILLLLNHFGGDYGVSFGMAQPVNEGTVLGYTNDGLFVLESPSAIMVRLVLDETACEPLGVEEIAASFNIGQNIPNPFNANTRINYSLLETGNVSIEFVDVTGKLVQSIDKGVQNPGDYTVVVDGSNFAEGVYFYTFTVGNEKITKRMVVTK
ncbi:T9SS type A sorting domain-containing protein [Crocinitomix catalasitica]|uniref:T9SS type A sorting domain-containing protein n=1 Tax=Crocinitomix catalasitica TaxID=184607 RepID=UPI00048747B3|nr:T9SS type A sorting domain-containing protein [Crocinitomix catalasitica]